MKQPWHKFPVFYRDERTSRSATLLAGTHFHCGLDEISQFFSKRIPNRWLDLVRVAAAVYFVDRLVPRAGSGAAMRHILIDVGIQDLNFWNYKPVTERVRSIAEFLSGDSWDITFRATELVAKRRMLLDSRQPKSDSPSVCLYSGGLDSAAGFVGSVRRGEYHRTVAVTVHHQPGQQQLTEAQFKTIDTIAKCDWRPLLVPVGIYWKSNNIDRRFEETSQRCRAFLFAAIGAVAAGFVGARSIDVFESGVGALNVPPMAGMLGSMVTRGCHPGFLRRMSELTSLVFERDADFILPNARRTKAQMVEEMIHAGGEQLIAQTVSCASYPLREQGPKQCGVCAACLLRRQSILCAGGAEPPNSYKYDLFDDGRSANAVPSDKLNYLKAYLMQVAEIAEASKRQTLPNPMLRFLKAGDMRTEELTEVQPLFWKYADEWIRLAARSRQRECRWANLLLLQDNPQTEQHAHVSA